MAFLVKMKKVLFRIDPHCCLPDNECEKDGPSNNMDDDQTAECRKTTEVCLFYPCLFMKNLFHVGGSRIVYFCKLKLFSVLIILIILCVYKWLKPASREIWCIPSRTWS